MRTFLRAESKKHVNNQLNDVSNQPDVNEYIIKQCPVPIIAESYKIWHIMHRLNKPESTGTQPATRVLYLTIKKYHRYLKTALYYDFKY